MGRVKEETISGAKWGIISRCTLQPATFIFGIVLARFISPEEQGILGLTAIFFAVAALLQNCGFGTALIRKQDRTDKDINTVFWFNTAASFFFCTLIWFLAPWFAVFFNQPPLVWITRISAVMMFFGAASNVHWVLLSAQRNFRIPALINISSTLVAIPFTLWAAAAGWSYWALVLYGVLQSMVSLIAIWIYSPWKPSFAFSLPSFCEFFAFGSKLICGELITVLYDNTRTFIIGKFFSPAQLGNYSKGNHLCEFPIGTISGVLSSVTFPILVTLQDNPDRLLEVYRKYIRITCMPILWIMTTLAANSSSIVYILYGEDWLGCAIYAQILCFGTMFNPLTYINFNLMKVLGRSDTFLRATIIMRSIGFPAMFLGAWLGGVEGVCYAAVLSATCAVLTCITLSASISSLKVRHQLADFLPYLLMSLIANIPSYLISSSEWHPLFKASAGILLSLGIYLAFLLIRRDTAGALIFNTACEKIPFLHRLRLRTSR